MVSTHVLIPLLVVLVAAALPTAARPSVLLTRDQCDANAGAMHCCNNVQRADSPTASNLLMGLLPLGTSLAGSTPVGINCTPIPVAGVGSSGNWYEYASHCRHVPEC